MAAENAVPYTRVVPRPTVTIRPGRDSDRDPVTEILAEVVAEGATVAYDTTEGLCGYWFDPRGALFVAEVDDVVQGTYVVKRNQPGRGDHVANAGYAVRSSGRGRGIGRALAEHSLTTARAMGFSAMQFNFVVASNQGAVRLWQDVGFQIVGTVPDAFRHADGRRVAVHVFHRAL